MLNKSDARRITLKNLPGYSVQKIIEYKNLFIVMAYGKDPLEGQFDPFFSVDKETGKFSDFSIITDCNTDEVMDLFKQEGGGKNDK